MISQPSLVMVCSLARSSETLPALEQRLAGRTLDFGRLAPVMQGRMAVKEILTVNNKYAANPKVFALVITWLIILNQTLTNPRIGSRLWPSF
jgi:hypothetical protein